MARIKLILLIVITSLLVTVVYFIKPAPPSSVSSKDHFWSQKAFSRDHFDVVFCGDSRTYRRINPEVIDSTIGISSFNFGFNAGGISLEIVQAAQKKLNSDTKGTIVLGVSPSSLLSISQHNEHYMQEKNVRWSEKAYRLRLAPYLAGFDPVHPGNIYNHLKSRRIGYFENFEVSGFVASERIPSDTTIALYSYKRLFEKNKIGRAQLDSLNKVLDYLVASDVQVIAWRPKGSAAMTKIEDSLSGYRENEIRQLVESCGGIWLDTPLPTATYDGSHVPIAVAQEFSRNFAFQLKEVLKSTHP
jgi:hypothetical protein